MLSITITKPERYDEKEFMFYPESHHTIDLEHSLVSLSKWESKWCKPFLTSNEKTYEETVDYIRCMTVTKRVDADLYDYITNDQYQQILEYIHADMTATTFPPTNKSTKKEIITSELIYYWMITLGVPFECQKWHLNRLLTLINVCNIKNSPPKKVNKQEIAKRNAELNAMRKQTLGTQG